MDFHTLPRRDLQALCKKNRIPANLTNVAMADALQSLLTVEGIEELQESQFLSPKKAELVSPAPPRTRGRTSTRRRRVGPTTNDESKASPLPRARRVTAKASEMMDLVEGAEEEVGGVPATPKVHSRRRVGNKEESENNNNNNKSVTTRGRAMKKSEDVVGVTTRRKVTRQSSKKEVVVMVTSAATTTTRRSTRGGGGASVEKMAALVTNEEEQNNEIEFENAVDEKKKNSLEDNFEFMEDDVSGSKSLEENNSELVVEEEESSENESLEENNSELVVVEEEEEEEVSEYKSLEKNREAKEGALSGLEDSPVIGLMILSSEPTTANHENLEIVDDSFAGEMGTTATEEEEVVVSDEFLEEPEPKEESSDGLSVDLGIIGGGEVIEEDLMMMMMMMGGDESANLGDKIEVEEAAENNNKLEVLAGAEQINAETVEEKKIEFTDILSNSIFAGEVEVEVEVEAEAEAIKNQKSLLPELQLDQENSLPADHQITEEEEIKEFTANNNISFSVQSKNSLLAEEEEEEGLDDSHNIEIPVPAENKESLKVVSGEEQVPMVAAAAAGICMEVVNEEGGRDGDNKENMMRKFENMSLRKLKATYKEELVKIGNSKVEERRSALAVLDDHNRI